MREFTLDDAPLLLEWNKDPRMTRYMERDVIDTIEEAQKRLKEVLMKRYETQGIGRWAVHLKSTDEFLGWCGISYSDKDKAVTLGYGILPKFWGKGYATEAAKASVEFGLKELKFERVIAKAAKENFASIAVMKRLGMVYLRDDLVSHDPAVVYTTH